MKLTIPRTENQWFEIITGLQMPKKPEGKDLFAEHCPNCKAFITRNNPLSFNKKTICTLCQNNQ